MRKFYIYVCILLILLLSHGEAQFRFARIIGSSGGDWGKFVFLTPDDNFILIGGSDSYPENGGRNTIAVKFDSLFNIISGKGYSAGNVYQAVQMPDGIAALTDSGVIKIDYDLNLLWCRKFLGNTTRIHPDHDGGLVLIVDSKVVKTDQFGFPVWTRSFSIPPVLHVTVWTGTMDCISTYDSCYVITIGNTSRYTDDNGNRGYRECIAKISESGNIVWSIEHDFRSTKGAASPNWILGFNKGFIIVENTNAVIGDYGQDTLMLPFNLILNTSCLLYTSPSPRD